MTRIIEKYWRWENVPDNLKTKTQLGKMGLRIGKDQRPAGVKLSSHRKTPDYDLYEVANAEPKRQANAPALEKARLASLDKRTCTGCGYVEQLGRRYRGKIYVVDGLCTNCRDDKEIKERRVTDRAAAIAWARDVLSRDGVVFLDTETTDLRGEVIELAIVDKDGRTLFNSRFRPNLDIEPGAAAVHGLTAAMLVGEPDWSEKYEEIREILTGKLVLIYNADFDVSRIECTCRLRDLDLPAFDSECVMLWYAQFCGVWSRWHGSYTWRRLPGGDHSALGDCRAALDVVKSMAAMAAGGANDDNGYSEMVQ